LYDNVKHAAQSGASVASDFMHAGGKVAGAVADPDGRDGRQVKKQIDKTVKGVQKTANQRAKRAVDDTKAALYAGGQSVLHEASALWEGESEIPSELSKTFPWAGGILKPNSSVWDFFKSLIDTALRYWWMQQWLAGYVVWAVYVGLECKHARVFLMCWLGVPLILEDRSLPRLPSSCGLFIRPAGLLF